MSNEFKAQFVNEMNRLANVFPGINNKERIARYFGYVSDLDLDALKDVINGFIDNSRQMPLPVDFEKAAKDFKRNYFLKTGKYYSAKNQPQVQVILDCQHCLDTGVNKIVNVHHESETWLLRCDCAIGLNNKSIMPHWAFDLKALYKRESLNPKWFNPMVSEKDSESEINSKINRKVKEWKSMIQKSEKYWIELGYAQNSNLEGVG